MVCCRVNEPSIVDDEDIMVLAAIDGLGERRG